MMKVNYDSFGMQEFLDDPYFIAWVKDPDEDSNSFWNTWIQKQPSNLDEMKKAAVQLKAFLSVEKVNTGSFDAGEVWNRIERSIQPADVYPMETRSNRIHRGWWVAAAIFFLVMSSGAYFFLIRQNSTENTLAHSSQSVNKDDIAPGGNKAILTLADGSTIVLDSARNGMLSQQGNAKVVKLQDGKVAYDQLAISNKQLAIQYNTITTPRGGQYQLTLADGSRVWLNAASSITFPTAFTGDTRDVSITGEAYFEVAHDAKKPFAVKYGDMSVQVLGTHFNVKTYSDAPSIQVTLLEGGVKVTRRNDEVLLSPGWQAVIRKSGNINIDKDVNIAEVMAWKNGKFVFDRADIQTVMRRLGRWYDMDVIYKGNVTAHFGGTVSMNVPVSKVFEMLEMTGGAKFEIAGNKVTVMPGDLSGH